MHSGQRSVLGTVSVMKKTGRMISGANVSVVNGDIFLEVDLRAS